MIIDKYKIIKIVVGLLLGVTLIINFINWLSPEIYLSYATGYSVTAISNFHKENYSTSAIKNLCSVANPDLILKANGQLRNFSWLMIEVSFVILIVLFLFSKTGKINPLKQSKHIVYIFIILLCISFVAYILADLKEASLDFINRCVYSR